MKTGYEQHFKKIKQTAKPAQALNIRKKQVSQPSSSSEGKIKKAFPLTPLISFIVIAASGLLFLDQFENVEGFLQKLEFSIPTAHAEESKASEKALTPEAEASASANVVAGTGDKKTVQVEAKKIDDADYLFKLADRKKQLDQREEELNKVAAQIEKQKVEINEKLAQMEDVRQKISAALQDRIKADDGKVDVLVQMYTNMKPIQAAKVFETLDEDLVIEILSRMKKKSAADILNLIKAEKAQLFAERYTGYRTPAGNGK